MSRLKQKFALITVLSSETASAPVENLGSFSFQSSNMIEVLKTVQYGYKESNPTFQGHP